MDMRYLSNMNELSIDEMTAKELEKVLSKTTGIDSLDVVNFVIHKDMFSFVKTYELHIILKNEYHALIVGRTIEELSKEIEQVYETQYGTLIDNLDSISASTLLNELISRFNNEYCISVNNIDEYKAFLNGLHELAQIALDRLGDRI